MLKTKTEHINRYIALTVLALTLVCNANAQSNPFYSINYSDSAILDGSSDFIYNNISLTNVFSKNITLDVSVLLPDGWQMLGDQQQQIDLAPGEATVVPVTISKLPNTVAKWSEVAIKVHLKNSPDTNYYHFYIKTVEKESFYANTRSPRMELSGYQQSVDLKLFVKNKGNIDEGYNVHISNAFFNIDKIVKIKLSPGTDTTYVYPLKISKLQWKDLHEQDVRIEVTSERNKKRFYSYNYVIKKMDVSRKQHESPYATFPLSLESGVAMSGNQLAYYWGASGAIKINDNSNLSFSYRSRQYGVYGYQQDLFTLIYNYKDWQFSAGQINAPLQFPIAGQGIKVMHSWGDGCYASIYGILPYANSPFTSKDIGGDIRYKPGNMIFTHVWAVDFDDKYHTNSYLENNEFMLLNKKNIGLTLKAGAGFDHSTMPSPKNPNDVIGTSLGYNFKYHISRFSFLSNVLLNDNNYPGTYKGFRNESHSVTMNFKKTFYSIYYQYSYTEQNFFRDSIYITDLKLANICNYGISGGWHTNDFSISLNTGIMSQTNPGYVMPKFQSYGMDMALNTRKVNAQFNALTGFLGTFQFDNNHLATVTQRASINTKYFGAQENYYRLPQNSIDISASGPLPYTETITVSPFLNVPLLNKRLLCRLQYNYSKTSGAGEYNSVGGAITYNSNRLGLYISASGYVPIQQNAFNQYLALDVKKSFKVPVLTKREYYNLNMVFFEDANGNRKYDKDERMLDNIQVGVNDMQYLTDGKGAVALRNMDPGYYKLNLIYAKGIKGYIPTNGYQQSIYLNDNTTYSIPFKKSKYVSGKIDFELTSKHSLLSFNDIKITATDSAGTTTYTTLTDDNGEYYFNLPAGKYTISLNPEAFDERMKPKQLAYNIDLVNNDEAQVIFDVIQKKRETNIMNVNLE